MAKAAKKPAALFIVNTRDHAETALKTIGWLERFVAARESRYEAKVAEMKSALVEQCSPMKKSVKRLIKALEKWAAGEIPAADSREGPRGLTLNFGRVWFRWTPPAIKLSVDEEIVIARLKARGLDSCVRVVESINKEVLETLDDEDLKVVGAYRDQEEKFYYEVKREEVK